uniref:Uncharacterized protein n=1 Tax=Anguilla anguilla TaxID=7936 RepID=A0A0E9SQ14_ANGAN
MHRCLHPLKGKTDRRLYNHHFRVRIASLILAALAISHLRHKGKPN